MKITIWVATRDRATMVAAMELVGVALLLLFPASWMLRVFAGLPLLVHLGYTAMTALPVGVIPGRPEGSAKLRRNYDLRARVVAFLNEVRRVEEYARKAKTAGLPAEEVKLNLLMAERRLMEAASQVIRQAGQVNPLAAEEEEEGRGRRTILTHARPELQTLAR